MSKHVPTFTDARWFGMHDQPVRGVGLYCSCGWVWGMGSRRGCDQAFDNHLLSVMGVARMDKTPETRNAPAQPEG